MVPVAFANNDKRVYGSSINGHFKLKHPGRAVYYVQTQYAAIHNFTSQLCKIFPVIFKTTPVLTFEI
jgi:hypothetical protein